MIEVPLYTVYITESDVKVHCCLQGYLAHTKLLPPRTVWWGYA